MNRLKSSSKNLKVCKKKNTNKKKERSNYKEIGLHNESLKEKTPN